MSWWVILYFVVYGLLAVAGLWTDFYDRKPLWFLACAIGSNLVIAFLAVSFWNRSLLIPFGHAAPIAFVASVCWESWQVIDDVRTPGPDSSFALNIAVVLTVLILCLPAFIVAGLAAFS